MPMVIFLKEPQITVLSKDELDDGLYIELDRMTKPKINHGVMMFKTMKGRKMVIPALNIAMIQETTQKEIEENRKRTEQERKAMPGQLVKPSMIIPGGRREN